MSKYEVIVVGEVDSLTNEDNVYRGIQLRLDTMRRYRDGVVPVWNKIQVNKK